MRKILALAMVTVLSLTLAIALMGCGQKAEETPAATETTPAETTMDTTMSGGMDSTMQDTTMAH